MPLLHIRLFRELALTDHRGNSLHIGNPRTQSLIAYLALQEGLHASISQVGTTLFGSASDEVAVRSVIGDAQYAFRFLPPDVLIEQDGVIGFSPEGVTADAILFRELHRGGTIQHIRQAAELYRGNLLENFESGLPAFDAWLAAQRIEFWRAAVSVFARLLAAQIRAGWWESAVETAARLLTIDPSHEVVHRTLMRLQLEQGRPDSALRRYNECVDILRRESGRAPSPETERVHEEIMAALGRTPAPREMTISSIGRPLLVLLVEDDLVSSALVEGFLTEAGYEVVAVADGADALIEIGKRHFDLLILDINLPTLSGLRLFEIMMQKGFETPAIFITGMPGPDVETRSLELGAADFLRKPLRKETLLTRVRSVLQQRLRSTATND